MKFEFWLKNEKEKVDLLLPVTPKGYEKTLGRMIETLDLTGVGDVNFYGNRKAITIDLESLFCLSNETYVNRVTYSVNSVIEYVKLIENWILNKDIVRLIISDENETKINTEFLIEEIISSEDNKSNGDINFRIRLREYRPLVIMSENTIRNELTRAVKETPNADTYTVVSSDNLTKIARKMYGDGTKWIAIYNANKTLIGNNPNLIYPGQKLTIPGGV